MDGVLVDGEPLHFRSVNALLAREDRSLTLEEYLPYMGTKAGWRELVSAMGLAHPVETYAAPYDELVLNEYRTAATALPGAVELVRTLRQAGVPLAVASSSARRWVEACLDRIGLLDQFDVVVTGSDIDEGKPSPEIYLTAAERLGVRPELCLAFEDAPAGIISARAAGMTCWAVRTEYTRDLELPDSARELESLAALDAADILGVMVP